MQGRMDPAASTPQGTRAACGTSRHFTKTFELQDFLSLVFHSLSHLLAVMHSNANIFRSDCKKCADGNLLVFKSIYFCYRCPADNRHGVLVAEVHQLFTIHLG